MSYYYRHEFKFSDHGLQRIKQRLNLSESNEWEIKEKVLDMIENSTRNFETNDTIYIYTGKGNIFFVIAKREKLIITTTPISPERELKLINRDIY
ncbi:hypothetical protein [Spiroplasma tabanidicola]|uniref:DUF4258 domain-containing protein n=1 Tax=Spiroplasma tabanidicola TaxID=324079 RepID=A0A6I6C895_9MOLU|nr:hypothetical protein [Spiroplasma tabanidicola]QGS51956.1 hypothetical protein STABA_v1c05930 [Spiroplasma tabanidicola]